MFKLDTNWRELLPWYLDELWWGSSIIHDIVAIKGRYWIIYKDDCMDNRCASRDYYLGPISVKGWWKFWTGKWGAREQTMTAATILMLLLAQHSNVMIPNLNSPLICRSLRIYSITVHECFLLAENCGATSSWRTKGCNQLLFDVVSPFIQTWASTIGNRILILPWHPQDGICVAQ